MALRIDDLVTRFEVCSRVLPPAHAPADEQPTECKRDTRYGRDGEVIDRAIESSILRPNDRWLGIGRVKDTSDPYHRRDDADQKEPDADNKPQIHGVLLNWVKLQSLCLG